MQLRNIVAMIQVISEDPHLTAKINFMIMMVGTWGAVSIDPVVLAGLDLLITAQAVELSMLKDQHPPQVVVSVHYQGLQCRGLVLYLTSKEDGPKEGWE